MLTIASIDRHVGQLFEVIHRVSKALADAGIEYRLVGGMAVYFHVEARDPLKARLTRDVDLAIDRDTMEAVAKAAKPYGFDYRRAAGVDMLVDASQPSARSAVHLIFVREKVRPNYPEPVPGFSPADVTEEGVLLAPVADLVRMKLTSFRLKDQVHIQDMDSVGLITPEIESGLPELLRDRLAEVRASE